MASPEPLPSFKFPPVVETVLSATFREMPTLRASQLIEFWADALRGDYPRTQEVPSYATTIERFGPRGGALNLEIGIGAPSPRFWFISDTDTHLVQLQPDWIAHNWRARPQAPDYERYPMRRAAFADLLSRFDEFLRGHGHPPFEPVQCEVTYINQIEIASAEHWHEVLATFTEPTRKPIPGPPEGFQFLTSYLIGGDQPEPLGRLHVAAQSALRTEDSQPIVVLNLTARGGPLGKGIEGVLDFADVGREWIVRSFYELTTSQLHEKWERLT